jgi:hypothetical protein
MRNPGTTVLLLITSLSLACGGEPRQATVDDAKQAGSEAEEAPGRDLSGLDVCQLISAEAVATGMANEAAESTADYDPGFEGKGCRYASRGPGPTRYAEISLHPPADFEFRRQMRTKEAHELAGLGDAAWWEEGSDRTELFILKRGDASIWIRFQESGAAPTEDEARRLGEAVLAQVR